jgi:O-antigen/teichoic acid export membrane protein
MDHGPNSILKRSPHLQPGGRTQRQCILRGMVRSGRPPLLRRLVSESAIYGLGGVANQALAIILVPIYARQLGLANYGVLAIVNTTLSLGQMVTALALPQAFFRSYLKESETEADRLRVLRAALGLRLLVSTAGLAVVSLLAVPLTRLLFGGVAELPVLLLIGPIIFFDSLNLVPLSFLRAQRRPRPYAALAFVRAVLGSVLIIVMVVVFRLGVLGVVMGSLGSSVVTSAIGLIVLSRSNALQVSWDWQLMRHMLLFSLPIVPAAVGGWVLNLSDRYVVQLFDGRVAVGIYAAGYTVGLAINALVIQPFTLAWGAAFWEIARQDGAPRIFARVMTGFAVLASTVALGLSAFGTDAIRLLLPSDFDPARFVVPFAAFAYVAYGLYSIAATGLNLASQTRWVPITVGVSAVVAVGLNLALVPWLGYLGAAISTLVTYPVLAVLTGYVGQRYYPVPWQLVPIVSAFVLGLGLAGAALGGPDNLFWRLGCFVVYVPLLLALRLVRPAELVAARDALLRRAPS